MFFMATSSYTNLIVRQRQFVRRCYHFKPTKTIPYKRCPQYSLLQSTTKTQECLQICRMKHDSESNISASKFSIVRRIWGNIFGKYLLTTNIVGSGILMVFGDIMAQEIECRRGITNSERYDWQRIGRMFVVGALQGPLHHYVYNWMDKVMPVANFRNVMKKILIDELVMSPICIFIFFYSACFLERKTLKETNDELKEKFFFIYLIDWLLWPGAQYINFRYLDTKYRVTFVNVCTALYNIFMSYVKHDYSAQL